MDGTVTRKSHAARWPTGYPLVLLLIAGSYALSAAQTSPNPNPFAFLLQLGTVAVIFWVAEVRRRLRQVGWTVLAAAAVAVAISQLFRAEGHLLDTLLSGASMVAYLIAPVAILAHQLRRRIVDGQTLIASIAAYISVGMFFTFVYNFAALISNVPTFGPDVPDSLTSQLFFSFTTLTTTGYGNIVPAGPVGQSVAIAEAITGQLFLIVAVARVVSGWHRREK